MKQIQFLRHYKLKAPFDHWSNMTWDQFKSYTQGVADPDISIEGIEEVIAEEIKIKKIDSIITANKTRTIDTGKYIKQYLNLSCPLTQSNLFNEIPSVIDENLTELQFEALKKEGNLYVKKHRTLDDVKTYQKLLDINKYLVNLAESNILVISSSYLIGQLNYFYNYFDSTKDSYNLEIAKQYEIGGWLKGFTVSM